MGAKNFPFQISRDFIMAKKLKPAIKNKKNWKNKINQTKPKGHGISTKTIEAPVNHFHQQISPVPKKFLKPLKPIL